MPDCAQGRCDKSSAIHRSCPPAIESAHALWLTGWPRGWPMRMRKWIGVLALASVLLHAAALVRHNTVMTGANLQYQALVESLTQICHGSGVAGNTATTELPYIPPPSNSEHGCPICSGLGPSMAVAA